ncbi:hypothetical protein ACQ5SO_03660 [Rhodovulum sp. DZ06]|uniref:hypothetical protein n=1 Tax=Rhodovulum sp. DZ06 TaxID=3425126 RepID=UPI003D330980
MLGLFADFMMTAAHARPRGIAPAEGAPRPSDVWTDPAAGRRSARAAIGAALRPAGDAPAAAAPAKAPRRSGLAALTARLRAPRAAAAPCMGAAEPCA